MAEKDYIPYGRQHIDEDDIQAVVDVLRSDWLTTGPKVDEFEQAACDFTGAKHGVAVSSGTAALHAAMFAIGIELGDEVIVPPMTFAATANCILYQGGTPVFADVEPDTLLIDPKQVEKVITGRTKAIIAVDYAGQPCDYDALRDIAERHGLILVSDACHSIGGAYKGRNVGTLADLTAFSFHPVKHITTGEGGMVMTDNEAYAERMRCFRNHGITTDHRQRAEKGAWHYEMVSLGFNYRITDIQCALGVSQLKKLPGWIMRRQEIVARYAQGFAGIETLVPLRVSSDVSHAYHLYVVRVSGGRDGRASAFSQMRENGIGVNVHYIPVHLHPHYRDVLGYDQASCPVALSTFDEVLSLPMYTSLGAAQQEKVISTLWDILA